MASNLRNLASILCLSFVSAIAAAAQSSDVNFPTNVTSSEIIGTVRARDIGDSRLTTFYYAFEGGQGDIFINVVTKNFSGDIDVFAADGLLPLTKIVIYANGAVNETGRLIYLRKGERLILRVQGRSPNDDPATFRIKFGGSFIAMAGKNDDNAPKIDTRETVNGSGVRVNSVGTIIEVIPKPQPQKKAEETPPETRTAVKPKEPAPAATPAPKSVETVAAAKPAETEKKIEPPRKTTPKKKAAPEVPTVFGNPPKAKPKRTVAAAKPVVKPPAKPAKTEPAAPSPPPEVKADPLASIRLVVQLKDGTSVERPMSEVTKFSVDKGVLTVIQKDGITLRFSIFDVAKVTIE